MHRPTTRSSLLTRVRDPADEGAWREFDERYRDLILRYCRGRGLQPTDAEDVRQMVMMSLARSMRDFRYRREVGRFRSYLGCIVRNAISKFVSCPTGVPRQLPLDDLDLLPDRQDEVADSRWEQEWMGHHFRHAMRKAKKAFDPQSLLIFEQLLAGGSPAALAASYGVSPAAIYKIKHRVRDHLQSLIAEQISEEDQPKGTPER